MEERKQDMKNLKTVSDEKEEHPVLEKKIGRTRYHVHLFFDPNSKETIICSYLQIAVFWIVRPFLVFPD